MAGKQMFAPTGILENPFVVVHKARQAFLRSSYCPRYSAAFFRISNTLAFFARLRYRRRAANEGTDLQLDS